eukprot:330112-Pyramimonas_sp.AAC.1
MASARASRTWAPSLGQKDGAGGAAREIVRSETPRAKQLSREEGQGERLYTERIWGGRLPRRSTNEAGD